MALLDAMEFLTRIRVRRGGPAAIEDVAAAQAWFPLAGLAIGAALLAVDRLASRALPAASVDVLLVVALAAITGGLHLDGLADAADGLLGAHDPERRLEIMRDTHSGSFAIVAVVSVLALKWAGLAGLPAGVRYETLLLVPCLARFAMVVASAACPYARPAGMGAAFHARAWPAATLAAAATAAGASVALLGAGGAIVLALAAAYALAFGAAMRRMAGGMTGDLYGATIESGEAMLLLLIAALAQRGWLEAWLLR